MYSGTTLTAVSGRLVGAHQKIDRVARRNLTHMLAEIRPQPKLAKPRPLAGSLKAGLDFPTIKTILHFEGRNGPDGIKRKSPAKDEPWHYLSPFDENDTMLMVLVQDHYDNLVRALIKDDMVVAGFEAAWLAHAVVDGLTPAHHYPYEEKLDELRGGRGKDTRVTIKDKVVMPGATKREAISNNWKMWGAKGLLTTHFAFEWGVASIMLPMRLGDGIRPTANEVSDVLTLPASEFFSRSAKEVAALGMYDDFIEQGWTPRMARAVRQQLVPATIKTVTLLWYRASMEAADMLPKAGRERV